MNRHFICPADTHCSKHVTCSAAFTLPEAERDLRSFCHEVKKSLRISFRLLQMRMDLMLCVKKMRCPLQQQHSLHLKLKWQQLLRKALSNGSSDRILVSYHWNLVLIASSAKHDAQRGFEMLLTHVRRRAARSCRRHAVPCGRLRSTVGCMPIGV